jgi:hypothetical protein
MNSFDMYTRMQAHSIEMSELAAWAENDGQHELATHLLSRMERISKARQALTGRILDPRNPKALAKLHAAAKASR